MYAQFCTLQKRIQVFESYSNDRSDGVMCFLLEIVSSSGSGASVGSELLVDKSRLAPKVNM